jgi:hypothetical protein
VTSHIPTAVTEFAELAYKVFGFTPKHDLEYRSAMVGPNVLEEYTYKRVEICTALEKSDDHEV